jgi:hypothetical protein
MVGRTLLLLVVAAALCAASVALARTSATPLDVELAIDTTNSMGPSLARIQRNAEKLVTSIQAHAPGAHVALVQFKDFDDTPEYELVQPMTGDPKAVAAAASQLSAGGGGDNPEAYNVVFRNSFADSAVGWRDNARKVVVVVGDAEPHGAGAAHFPGCLDASPDPHRLSTRRELASMKASGRTLIMVRQAATATADLTCYESLSAAAYPGGEARDAGSGLISVILGTVYRAAGVKGPVAPVKQSGPSSPQRSTTDRTPPRVVAVRSGGYPGTNIRLLYRVTDNSGRSSDKVAVYSGARVLTKSGWNAFGPANGKLYFFDFPAPASMAGSYSFCVESRDPAGNVSKPSCAPLVLQ